MIKSIRLKFLLLLFLLSTPAIAQDSYRSYPEMTEMLQQLASEYPDRVSLESIATSPGGHNIWKLTIGTGDIENKPALAVVAGVDGSHILGIELALKTAESILNAGDDETTFSEQVVHIFPNMNPDASEQYFSSLKYERSVNSKDTDLDRDGRVSEDPFDDLNNDGMITMMRVEDTTGEWAVHGDDSRIMVKADPLNGENGSYRLFSEGIDRDQDAAFNDDPSGGVNLNKNFTYQFPAFEYGSGEFPVSEAENRALLDLLYDSFHVYAVLSFSPNNNLSDPWTYNRSEAQKRVITSVLERDAEVFKSVSDLYKETVPQENASGYSMQHGGFAEWAYFHYARFSFTTDGWWLPPLETDEKMAKSGPSHNEDLNWLRWAESKGFDLFAEWQEVDHPGFPDKKVEVGGFHPFSRTSPPYSLVDSLADVHTEFLVKLAEMRPDLVFENISVQDAGRNLTRITMDLHNRGHLPTSTELGTRTQWVRPVNVQLEMDESMDLVSGKPRFQIERLSGRESQQITWLVRGTGPVSISAGTPSAGFANFQQTIR